MVDPDLLCRSHLLGEHRELHALAGMIAKGISLTGYVNKGLIQTGLIEVRHNILADEIEARGYSHRSPLTLTPSDPVGHVNEVENIQELKKRCTACRERIVHAASQSG